MRGNRFTIYDALDKTGYFDKNPANSTAYDKTTGNSTYLGPVQYPKMLYHPLGEEKITVPAELITTPFGPKAVGEQREMLWEIVDSQEKEAELVMEGWHDHPAKAVRARVLAFIEASPDLSEKDREKMLKAVPAMSSEGKIRDLETEIARLIALREADQVVKAPGPVSPGKSVKPAEARVE